MRQQSRFERERERNQCKNKSYKKKRYRCGHTRLKTWSKETSLCCLHNGQPVCSLAFTAESLTVIPTQPCPPQSESAQDRPTQQVRRLTRQAPPWLGEKTAPTTTTTTTTALLLRHTGARARLQSPPAPIIRRRRRLLLPLITAVGTIYTRPLPTGTQRLAPQNRTYGETPDKQRC